MSLLRKKRKEENQLQKFARKVDGKYCQPFSLTVDLIFSQSGRPWIVINGASDKIIKSNSLEDVLIEINNYVKERFT